MTNKKTNSKPRLVGGVNKNPTLRVKVLQETSSPSAKTKSKSRELQTIDVTSSDVEVVKKKKKKKKVRSSLELAASLSRKLSKSDGDAQSIIGDSAEEILQMLEEGNTQSAVPMIYKKLLQTLVDTIPDAENAIRASKGAKGVYQLNSLISSMREIMVDIQSSQDRGQLGASIVESILRPSYQTLAMSVLTEYKALADDFRLALEGLSSKPRLTQELLDQEWQLARKNIKQSRQRLADAMQSQYKETETKIIDYLQR